MQQRNLDAVTKTIHFLLPQRRFIRKKSCKNAKNYNSFNCPTDVFKYTEGKTDKLYTMSNFLSVSHIEDAASKT